MRMPQVLRIRLHEDYSEQAADGVRGTDVHGHAMERKDALG